MVNCAIDAGKAHLHNLNDAEFAQLIGSSFVLLDESGCLAWTGDLGIGETISQQIRP